MTFAPRLLLSMFLTEITKCFPNPYWKIDWIDRVSKLLSASFPVTLKTSCTKTVTMLRQNLYALLETGSKPAMNEVLTYTQGLDTYRIFMIS